MGKYIIFAGRAPYVYDQSLGYFASFIDRGVCSDFRSVSSTDSDGIDRFFPGDEKVKSILSEMNLPEPYSVLTAKVNDEARLLEEAPEFCRRYKYDFRIYEV